MAIIVESLLDGASVGGTTTPTADAVPKADGSGNLAAGWGGAASTLATLDGSTKVVEDPASATSTPTASSIPIADGSGKLAAGWGGSASTLATLDGSSLVVENPASATTTPTASSIPIADGSGDLDVGWVPATVQRWTKYTVAESAFTAAATTEDIELFSLPAGGIIHGVKIKHSASFTGGTLSAFTLSVGISGNLAKYASAFDVFQAAADTTFQLSTTIGSENHGSVTSIRLAATATGDNVVNATAGSVDVWVLTSEAV